MQGVYLTEIHRDPERRVLGAVWSDGHRAEFPYDYLRGYCPCAGCQGHAALEIRFHAGGFDVEPTSIKPVGNYGVSFVWSDGHSTGIYRFDFMRRICPCEECRADRGDAEATPPIPS